jgi:hypothetical protein
MCEQIYKNHGKDEALKSRTRDQQNSCTMSYSNPHARFRWTEDWDHRLHHPRHEGRLQLGGYDLSGRDRGCNQGTNIGTVLGENCDV